MIRPIIYSFRKLILSKNRLPDSCYSKAPFWYLNGCPFVALVLNGKGRILIKNKTSK